MGGPRWPWWTINGKDLMWALKQAYKGKKPKDVYEDLYRASEHEWPAEDQ